MKKLIIWGCLVGSICLSGCAEDPELPYENINRIYFENITTNSSGGKVALDSIFFSFGNVPEEIPSKVLPVIVRFNGRLADTVRTYRIIVMAKGEIKKGETSMEAGKDYTLFSETQIFRANSWTDTLFLEVHREFLNKSFRKQENKRLMLRLEASDDFELGIRESIEMPVITNDYLTKPQWWDGFSGFLNYYHPEKWKVLMSFNEKFRSTDVLDFSSFEIERTFAPKLRLYLENTQVVDEETNEYVLMDELVPVE